jgi:hypothetical protein
MPHHRNSEKLPEGLLEKVKSSPHSVFSGHTLTIPGGGLRRYWLSRPKLGDKGSAFMPYDVEYTLKDDILTRTEFARGKAAIPVHMSHHDPKTGKRFATVLDRF